MLSIARLRPSTAATGYYERAARAEADWATWSGIPAAEWAGTARNRLALGGSVPDGALTRLLLGRNPTTGQTLRPTAPSHAAGRPVAGFDLVFSAPKSVSLLLVVDDIPVPTVAAAHRTAWHEALALLESHACVVRRKGVGVTASGFVGAAFAHYANRDGEPHLHTHVVIANQTALDDEPGRWRAIDAIPLLTAWRWAAGALYEARLAAELAQGLGIAWRRAPHGGREVAGITSDQIAAASTRAAAVRRHADLHSATTAHGRRVAGRASRPPRRSFDRAERAAAWAELARRTGLPQHRDGLPASRAPRQDPPWHPGAGDPDLLGADGLTGTGQTFTHADLVAAVARSAPAGAHGAQILARAGATAALEEVIAVRPAHPGRPARYTTDEVLGCEIAVLEAAAAGRGTAGCRATPEALATALSFAHPALSAEQLRAAELAAAADDGVALIVGRAGAGKTTALAAAARALWDSGIPVTGAAPSAQAAHVLAQATGMPSTTLHALVARWDTGAEAPAGCIVVDEASMADSRILARVAAHLPGRAARLVLVGDPCQLPAVGPGGLFATLAARLGAVELTANHRQHATWEQEALVRLRHGDAEGALAEWDAHGRITRADDAPGALLEAWWATARGDPDSVMLAYRRDEVAALNRGAAQRLERAGVRGRPHGAGGVAFAIGDVVRCRINDPQAGLRNGLRGRVSEVDRRGGIAIDVDDGTRAEVPRDYLAADGVEHAWALTGHSAQGTTVAHAFVLAPPPGSHAEWSYVAMSRARESVRLFVPDGPEAAEPRELAARLARRAARPPAIVELAGGRDRADDRDPPPPDGSVAHNHKRGLTRALSRGR